jgi:hypothetical protein
MKVRKKIKKSEFLFCREISKVVAHMWETIEPEIKEVDNII